MEELRRRPATQLAGHPYGSAPRQRSPSGTPGGGGVTRRLGGVSSTRKGIGTAWFGGGAAGRMQVLLWRWYGSHKVCHPPGLLRTSKDARQRAVWGHADGWLGWAGPARQEDAPGRGPRHNGDVHLPLVTRALRYTNPGGATQRRRRAAVRPGLYGHRGQPMDVCSGAQRGRGCRRPSGGRSPRRAPPVTRQTMVHLGFCGS